MFLAIALALPSLNAAPAPSGNVLRVGSTQPYTTIQAAVDAAQNLDLVLVDPGSYPEFVVDGKSIAIVAASGSFDVFESTSLAPTIHVTNVPVLGEVTIVGAHVDHGASIDAPAVLLETNPGQVRFSDLVVNLAEDLAGTTAPAAFVVRDTASFWLIDSRIWSVTPRAAYRLGANGWAEGVSGIEVVDSEGVLQNFKAMGYDALLDHAGDGLRVRGDSYLYLVDDVISSPQRTLFHGGDGDYAGSGVQLFGTPAYMDRVTSCGRMKYEGGSGSEQPGGMYAINGDGGMGRNGGLRLPRGCGAYQYVETSVDSPLAPIGQPIVVRVRTQEAQDFFTAMSVGGDYQRTVGSIAGKLLLDLTPHRIQLVQVGSLEVGEKTSFQVQVPNDTALIGSQLTFQSLVAQSNWPGFVAFSFPSLAVVTP